MKNESLFVLTISLFLFACGNAEQEQKGDSTKPITSNDTNIVKKSPEKMIEEDRATFFTNAAIGGLMEVEASSKLLQNNKSDSKIRAHAQMIKDDHIKANEELKVIAQKERFTLPTVLPVAKLTLLKQLENLNDEAQNEFYINLMVTEHNEAINLFNLATTMADTDISRFASKTLPILRHHYDMTVNIKNSILKSKANQGDDVLKISNKDKNNPAKNN